MQWFPFHLCRDAIPWFKIDTSRAVFGQVDLYDSFRGSKEEAFVESLRAYVESFNCTCCFHAERKCTQAANAQALK